MLIALTFSWTQFYWNLPAAPIFSIMRLAVLVLAVFATLDLASSLTLDQPPSLRPSVSSFAISSPAGIRQVNAQDQKQRATASRISSIRGGSSGLLASAGGILTSAAVVGASNLIGFAFTIATGSVKAMQHLIPHLISSHLIPFCCIDASIAPSRALPQPRACLNESRTLCLAHEVAGSIPGP
jgi:hypothetical protein